MNGTKLAGRYELAGLIGAGGMGEVWRGRDLALERDVAVKLISRPGDDKLALRLRAEARAAASLTDPHVVSVHDVGETSLDGRTVVYLVMELVHGRPLGEKGGRVAVEDAVRWGVQICEGLQAAHGAGIVHRDIKPANILLTDAGRIKICDFGIARQSGLQGLTTTGSVTGTPAYMSPEQARGEELDARSDLYGLGCVLYELLTGAPPFSGTGWEILAQHANQAPVPARARRPEVPVGLNRLVLQLLSKDVADRPPSAADTAELLRAVLGPADRRGPAPQPTPTARDAAGRTTRTAAERPGRVREPGPVPRPAPGSRPGPGPGAPSPKSSEPSASSEPPKSSEPSKSSKSSKPAEAAAPNDPIVTNMSVGASWLGFLLPAVSATGQLVGFGVMSGFWAGVMGLAIGFVVWFSSLLVGERDWVSPFGALLSLATGVVVLVSLLLAPHVPWWEACLAGVGIFLVLLFAAFGMRRVVIAVSRAKESEAAVLAGDVGMAAGVLAAWLLLARTELVVPGALGVGAGCWLLFGCVTGWLMPRRRRRR
ncbi:serine/threonine-protein kinase [Streptomyces sp. NBC_00503]|uniref:serine/threonine-protein kinase n=1 Tax=Streptomyces sp. NBC_00503 TaxID=2903659 RepID=UPI002E80A4CE|nr:serine/threonine-protein kinase [Streptomyces sp. NBC_00503]WUD82947.1 serine/threonine protein kinase [Streptomyces sp. NBC_00503]